MTTSRQIWGGDERIQQGITLGEARRTTPSANLSRLSCSVLRDTETNSMPKYRRSPSRPQSRKALWLRRLKEMLGEVCNASADDISKNGTKFGAPNCVEWTVSGQG
jgi:hypothetical protein